MIVGERARAAVAARRATGGPWVGLLMGIERGEPGPPGVTELRAARAGGFLELAVLADFAVGAALRSLTGPGTVMPTLTLTLQLWGAEDGGDVRVRAEADSVAGTVASARAGLVGAAGAFGSCLATFAVAPAGAGAWTPLPWEQAAATPSDTERAARLDAPPSVEERAATAPLDAPSDPERPALALSAEERAAVALLDGPGSLGDRLAPLRWTPAPAGRSSGRIETGALHTNRAGAVQGGVLAGLAAASARRAAGSDGARVASFHLAYLRPAPPGELEAAAEVIHAGRRATLVRAGVTAAGAVVASATVALASE